MTDEHLLIMLQGWRQKHPINRDPDLCGLRFKCQHLIQDKDMFKCQLIEVINEMVAAGIQDFKQAKEQCERKERLMGKKYVLESFMSDAHNFGMDEGDYFPQHKVPFGCPFRLEFSLCQNGALDE